MSQNVPLHSGTVNLIKSESSSSSTPISTGRNSSAHNHLRNVAQSSQSASSSSSSSSLVGNSHHQHHNSQQSASIKSSSSTSTSSSQSQPSSQQQQQSAPSMGVTNYTGPLPDDQYKFPYCEDVNKYEKISKIGQGTFGEVFKAKHTKTRKLVALKKVLMENEKEGFPITALREIKILQLLKHENVVNLIEICRTSSQSPHYKATFYLVFDFCEHDLAGLLSNSNVKFNLGEIKKVVQQLLNGLFFIHKQKILHRDMKAANILITKAGVLKLADFGLARAISDIRSDRYTNRVVTLWYRPPELLLGARNYGPAIDLWGAGCIMAEMWTRAPILQGSTEQAQLTMISQLCGTITPEVWPGVEKLELYNKMDLGKNQRRKVKERLRAYIKCDQALDLIDKLLMLDPNKRIDSDSALNHDFFWLDPMPKDLGNLLSNYTNSMFEFTTQRRRALPQQQTNQPSGVVPHGYHPGHHPAGHRGGPPNRMGTQATGGQYIDRVF